MDNAIHVNTKLSCVCSFIGLLKNISLEMFSVAANGLGVQLLVTLDLFCYVKRHVCDVKHSPLEHVFTVCRDRPYI